MQLLNHLENTSFKSFHFKLNIEDEADDILTIKNLKERKELSLRNVNKNITLSSKKNLNKTKKEIMSNPDKL